MTSWAAAVVSADRFCPRCMCCKYGMTDGSIGRSPPSLIRAKQSCMRHHASVRLLAQLRVRNTCVPCADPFTCLCVHWRAYSCLCVRVCPSVCNKCRSMCTLPLRPRPEVPGEGSSVEAHWHVSRRTIHHSCTVVHTRARRPCSETCVVPVTGVQQLSIGSGWRGWMAGR